MLIDTYAQKKVQLGFLLSERTSGASPVIFVIIIILVVVVVLKKRCCKMVKRNVDMDVDASPVYGDYYYEDGGRRQNVVEVSKAMIIFSVETFHLGTEKVYY